MHCYYPNTYKNICFDRLGARMTKKPYDPAQFSEASNGASSESQLQERIKLLEMDYKKLHEKRLADVSASISSFPIIIIIARVSALQFSLCFFLCQLKTLQSAHERELFANKETVRLLEQRLAERDEAFAIIQKHNKIPIDYFALKAKVNSKKNIKSHATSSPRSLKQCIN